MAIVFTDSNAVGGGTGVDFANAFLDLFTALADAGTTAGSSVYVAHNHAAVYTVDKTLPSWP